jgi:hypothetical protein
MIARFLFRQPFLKWILLPLLILLPIFVFSPHYSHSLSSKTIHPPSTVEQLAPLDLIPPGAEQVKVGVYPINIYSLDIATNTYYLDAYVWFNWKGETDPITNVEFTNAVEEWGLTRQYAYPEPIPQPDGSNYQIVRIEGRFFQPFDISRYPLDQQRLGLQIENSIYPAEKLVYASDEADSGFANGLVIPGWRISGWQMQEYLHHYDSRFGDQSEQVVKPYSAIRYELLIFRPVSYFIWKLLLPLIIVLFAGWGSFLVHPSYVDIRSAMPTTALLTTVFLQQAYSYQLPEVGYLVLLDKIYVLAYILIISTLVEATITGNWITQNLEANDGKVKRLDRIFLMGQGIVLVVGLLLLVNL